MQPVGASQVSHRTEIPSLLTPGWVLSLRMQDSSNHTITVSINRGRNVNQIVDVNVQLLLQAIMDCVQMTQPTKVLESTGHTAQCARCKQTFNYFLTEHVCEQPACKSCQVTWSNKPELAEHLRLSSQCLNVYL